MDHHNNNHNTGNGFLLGLMLGGVVTLLFTTKKGREILKELTDKGLDKFSELQDEFEEKIGEEFEEIATGADYVQIDKQLVKKEINEIKKENKIPISNPQKKPVKRFFRRVKKS